MQLNKGFIAGGLALASAISIGQPAQAVDFELGSGWSGDWISSFSVGSSWRAQRPDPALYTASNGAEVGLPNGTAYGRLDTGNVNYFKGDRFSTLFKLLTEVSIKKDDMGLFVRGKAWYDDALENGDVRYGNQVTGFAGGEPMDDDHFPTLNKFSGAYILDAYVYDSFELAGQYMQVRAGRQVINWGESLFIQGVNQTSPIDVPSFRRPGAQVKEVLLPIWAIDFSTTLGDYGSLEAFYQFGFESTPIESCGNYWSPAEGHLNTGIHGCQMAVPVGGSSREVLDPTSPYYGQYVAQAEGKKVEDSGQFGVAYRFTSEALNFTEFGVYAQNLTARTPSLYTTTGDCIDGNGNNVCAAAGLLNPFYAFSFIPGVDDATTAWEYPEDVQVYGVSAAANIMGWSVSAELGHTRDFPAQISPADILNGDLTGLGPYGSYAAAQTAKGGGVYMKGYTRTNKTQFQLNTLKVGNGLLGAVQYLFLAEAATQWNSLDVGGDDDFRYGRAFIYGAGSHPTYSIGTPAGGNVCDDPTHPLYNTSPAGCRNDGYVTNFSWGYRAYMRLEYPNVLNTGVTLFPIMYFSHDVEGQSVDSQFVEDRITISPTLRFSYAKRYTLDLTYAYFSDSSDYDYTADRDYYSANATVNF